MTHREPASVTRYLLSLLRIAVSSIAVSVSGRLSLRIPGVRA
ncbi:hypothetical protein [Actinopolymorpha pittospori]|uniref:Uncharacterized protein n=1 Tax=Actinopolymorpha pittospori TaxID=648752 RepID=A0A927MPP9_9ACTN|nr:hypothetical protein [Actinopolymorpha pittospori]MBE1604389.1 hypothetical protein [Actinopolymorpha pittospori]